MRDAPQPTVRQRGIRASSRSPVWPAGALMIAILAAGCGGTATSAPATTFAPASATIPPGTASPATATEPPKATPTATPTTAPTEPATPGPSDTPVPLPGAATEALIAGYTETLRDDPNNEEALLLLGLAYYQHARETADPSDYARADEAFDRLLAVDPQNAEAIIGKGTLALARHDFAGALALGEQALTLSQVSRVYGVIGDAQVELGRYDQAVETVQAMVDTRPDLSSYSRVSYQRELHGQLDGAIEAMEMAVEAGGPATENTEYVRVVLGNLWFLKGDLDKAEASYAASLAHSPAYVFALAGLGRARAARGDLDGAIALYREASDRVPFPEFLIALGEAQEAAGRADDAADTYAYVRDIEGLFDANGVDTDLDVALFEAEHGTDPAAAVALARPAYERTPNIRAADALAWALYKNGQLPEARQRADEALRLGTLDPLYLYHAGMIALAQGDDDQARDWLTAALSNNPHFSPLHAPRAQAALDELMGGTTP